jgi:hypothetical protein
MKLVAPLGSTNWKSTLERRGKLCMEKIGLPPLVRGTRTTDRALLLATGRNHARDRADERDTRRPACSWRGPTSTELDFRTEKPSGGKGLSSKTSSGGKTRDPDRRALDAGEIPRACDHTTMRMGKIESGRQRILNRKIRSLSSGNGGSERGLENP